MDSIAAQLAGLTPAQKRELLAHKLRARSMPAATAVPLSFGQQGLWHAYCVFPYSSAYNITYAAILSADVQVDLLRQALATLVQRHGMLRATFFTHQGEVFQRLNHDATAYFRTVDATPWDDARLHQHLAAEADTPFDLEHGPVWRVVVYTGYAEPDTAPCLVLQVTLHHIVADLRSMEVFIQELGQVYHALATGAAVLLPTLPWQYPDYVAWHNHKVLGPEGERLWSYWRERLPGTMPVLDVPSDRPRPPVKTYAGARYAFALGETLTRDIRSLAATLEVTPFVIVLTAFHLLLARYSGQEQFVIATIMANRDRPELADLMGYLVNLVPLRADLSDGPDGPLTVATLCQRVKRVVLEALAHQDYPFIRLVEQLHTPRDPSRPPLCQVGFTWDQARRGPLLKGGLAGEALGARAVNPLTVATSCVQAGEGSTHSATLAGTCGAQPLQCAALVSRLLLAEQRGADLDLTLLLFDTGGALTAQWAYSTDLFESARIARMARHLLAILTSMVAHPAQRLTAISLLDASERTDVLTVWNATQQDYPLEYCVHQLLEAQVTQTPDAVAVSYAEQALTYRALHTRANQLAHHLHALGVGPQVPVGVCMERSLEMVVSLLAILKSGGAYLPLDPTYPRERLAFMLRDAGVQVLLTQRSLMAHLPETAARLVCPESDSEAFAHLPVDPPVTSVGPDDCAYVIYTSGSTGKPKGVQVTHRSVVNFLYAMRQRPGLSAADVVLAVTTIAFDIAALELYLPWLVGARVVLVSQEVSSDGRRLLEVLHQAGGTFMQATPATWHMLLAAGWQETAWLTIACGGEALPRELAEHLLARGAVVWNLYGPTETTVWSAVHQVEAAGTHPEPIGRPIANTQLYLLDRFLQPVPPGVPGALYIGGAGLARGYLGRPALTAERFLPSPFATAPGARVYDTGDVATYLADGTVVCLGRLDQQVKIRGFRIEPGEIEAALAEHPQVREAVVVVRRDRPETDSLIAYVVLTTTAVTVGFDSAEMRHFLREKLPNYMIPSVCVVLEAWPLTPNGKIDRQALPAPSAQTTGTYVAPRTPVEQQLAEIWGEVLGRAQVSVHENFFELGGDSVMAIQITTRAAHIGIPLTPKLLFDYPTLSALAPVVDTAPVVPPPPDTVTEVAPRTPLQQWFVEHRLAAPHPAVHLTPQTLDRLWQQHGQFEDLYPLSPMQQGLLFHSLYAPTSSVSYMQWMCVLQGAVDVPAWQRAWQTVTERHAILRTTFEWEQLPEPLQIVAPAVQVAWEMYDWRALSPAQHEARLTALLHADEHRGFDLQRPPLMRCTLIRMADEHYRFVWSYHHLIMDGWSLAVLFKELFSLYEAYRVGGALPLPPPRPYRDYIAWLHARDASDDEPFWRQALHGVQPPPPLPVARPASVETSGQWARQESRLSSVETAALQALIRGHHVTFNTLLQGIWALLLSHESGVDDILTGTSMAGRPSQLLGVETMIGVFINTVPVRIQVVPHLPLWSWLQQVHVRQVEREPYAYAPLAAVQRWSDVPPGAALFDSLCIFENYPGFETLFAPASSLTIDQPQAFGRTQYARTLLAAVLEARLFLRLTCDLYRCDSTTASRLLDHVQLLLRTVMVQPETTVGSLKAVLTEADSQRQAVAQQAFRRVRNRQWQHLQPLARQQTPPKEESLW